VFRKGLGRKVFPCLERTTKLRCTQHLAKLRRKIAQPAIRHADRTGSTKGSHRTSVLNQHTHHSGLRVVVEFYRQLHDHREKEAVFLLRKLDVHVTALHRDLEETANLVFILDRLHFVDRNSEHELIVEFAIGDLYVALVVSAVVNLLDASFY